MWLGKLWFLLTAVIWFQIDGSWLMMASLASSSIFFWWIFGKSRKEVFKRYYLSHEKRMKYYAKDSQYIRYLLFKKEFTHGIQPKQIHDALTHLDGQIASDSSLPIFSNPMVSVLVAAIIALVGSITGKLENISLVWITLALIILLYFSFLILGVTRTSLANLKEFKRFLLWAKEEIPLTII